MRNKDVKLNRKPLTEKQMDQFKNFNKVLEMSQANSGGLLQKSWVKWGLASLAPIVAGVYFLGQQPKNDLVVAPGTKTDSNIVTSSVGNSLTETPAQGIVPPIKGADIEFETFVFDANEGQRIQTKRGTSYAIPPNSFQFEDGTMVQGEVEFWSREFHDPMEVFLSGIPMEYDSAGVEHKFESAGMLDVKAFQDGKKLELVPGKQIDVSLMATSDDDKFNLYQLDSESGAWDFKDADCNFHTIAPKSEMTIEPTVEEVMIVEPVMAKEDQYILDIDYDRDAFPEFGSYEDVKFQVDNNKSQFDPIYYNIQWKDVKLSTANEEGLYPVSLSTYDTTIVVYTKPVFEAATYQKALTNFEENKSANRKRREKDLAKRVKSSEKEFQRFKAQANFPINSLAIYNLDFPVDFATKFAKTVAINARTDAGEKIRLVYAYNIDKKVTSCGLKDVKMRKGDHVLWGVTTDNKIATLDGNWSRTAIQEDSRIDFVVQNDTEEIIKDIRNRLY
ncbi:MAG: hypothetical protein MRY83_23145 [Flavobacteriales bacterium]|nr:hypothetical protein [Flavobacteriales bacterium]